MTQPSITIRHSLKLCMGEIGMTGSWLQDPGLASRKMNKIMM